jgi:hypothetical protein
VFDLREGIQRSAQALGVSPVDLATAISYETAGTFDPTKAGPTTQWGQHRGLIQWGEPQAQKYGVDWSNPVGSQLGEDGAVVKYLRDTGVQPGMGLLDIYSAINAGGVGRYGASDANNGGAPGTVRDKVEKQMAGHRRKAEELFGGGSTPGFMAGSEGSDRMGAPMQQQDQEQRGLFGIKPELAMALAGGFANLSRPGSGDQFLQNAYATQARGQKDAKSKKSRNQTAEWLRGNGYGEFADLVEGGAVSGGDVMGAIMQQRLAAPKDNRTSALKEYEFAKTQGYDGSFIDFQLAQKKAGAANISVGGSGGIPDLNVDQGKNTGFLLRMEESQNVLSSLEDQGSRFAQQNLDKVPLGIGNYLRDADFQRFDQARRDFVNALLRRESGAVISDQEFANAEQQYFPVPGDTPEVIEQKRKNRQSAIEGIRASSGAGAAYIEQLRAQPEAAGGGIPEGVEPEVWDAMTPEEKALFQ